MKYLPLVFLVALLSGCSSTAPLVEPSRPPTDVPVNMTSMPPFKLEKVASFEFKWGTSRFAFDKAEHIWLESTKVDQSGAILATVPYSGGFLEGTGVDSQGNFLALNNRGTLTKYAPDGTELWEKDYTFSAWGSFPFLVTHDDAIWIQGDGIEKLDSNGNTLHKLKGLGAHTFIEAPSGDIWLLGLGLTRLASDGKVIGKYLEGYLPEWGTGAVDAAGNLWLVTLNSGKHPNELLKVSPDGKILVSIPKDDLSGKIVIDKENNVWLTIKGSEGIDKYAPDGKHLGTIKFNTKLNGISIAVDPSDYLWIGFRSSNSPYKSIATKFSISS